VIIDDIVSSLQAFFVLVSKVKGIDLNDTKTDRNDTDPEAKSRDGSDSGPDK
jgi:hypothetical protein